MTNKTIAIPLSALSISAQNVRHATVGKIEELAALIKSQGLLQNLLVERTAPTKDAKVEHYGVIAGGRRLRALQLLAKRGDITPDYAVQCQIITSEDAEWVSVAENSGREPMHPADEFEAFKRMHAAGAPIEDIAAAFGVSTLVVQRRLKLANVAPSLIDLYRAGDMNLDQVMALAITDDHKLQKRIWDGCSNQWQRQARELRKQLTEGMVATAESGAARFVTVAAYEAAGGSVVRDLFAGHDEGYLQDEELLQRLMAEKLAVEVARLEAEGWSWVIAQPHVGYLDVYKYGRSKPGTRELTSSEQSAVAALDKQIKDLNQKADDSDDQDEDEADAFAEQSNTLAAQRIEILARTNVFTDRQKKKSGVLLGVNRSGVLEIQRGLIREADKPGAGVDATTGESAPKTRAVHSESLIRRLSAHRTAALAAGLLSAPRIALDLLCATLATRVIYNRPGSDGSVGLQITPQSQSYTLPQLADDLETSKAWGVIQARTEELRKVMPEDPDGLFKWLANQPTENVIEILCFCTASCISAVTGVEKERPLTDLQDALKLSMTDWWQPTQAGYLKHIRKDSVLAAVAGACGKYAAGKLEKLKKAQIDQRAEELLADKHWLPSVLAPIVEPKRKRTKKLASSGAQRR